MQSTYSHARHASQACMTAASRRQAVQSYSFVLSRCLGSATHYSFWLLEGNTVLDHWLVLADGTRGLHQPSMFLLQSTSRLLPAAHYDEGPCFLLSSEADTAAPTLRQALTQGHLTLCLEGQQLQGSYQLQRVGAGRGHTWQLTRVSNAVLQKLA